MAGIYFVEASPLATNPLGSCFRRFWHQSRYYGLDSNSSFALPRTPRLTTECAGYRYQHRRYRRVSRRPSRPAMCIFEQTSRFGDELVHKCSHPRAGPHCPERTYIGEHRRAGPSRNVPSFSSGFSTPTTELGPPTPTHEATYTTVTHSPGYGLGLSSPERKPDRSHSKRHHRQGSTATRDSHYSYDMGRRDSKPTVQFADPPRGPPRPPNRAAAAADPGSDSEGSRRKQRRPAPIDTSLPAMSPPPVVLNDAYRRTPASEDNDYTKSRKARESRDARDAAMDELREEERQREKEEKAKDDYYAQFEAPRGDHRAEMRAMKAKEREREEKEKFEKELSEKQGLESAAYVKFLADREKARDEARQRPAEDQSSPTWSSGTYNDRIKRGQYYTEELKRSPTSERIRSPYTHTPAVPSSHPAEAFTPRYTPSTSLSPDAEFSRLYESESRQTYSDRKDKDRSHKDHYVKDHYSPPRHLRHRSEEIPSLQSMKTKQALLEAEMAEAEARMKYNKTKRRVSAGDGDIEIRRDSSGRLVQRRKHKTGGSVLGDFQKHRVRVFNSP
ncbi:uncharacterized protein J3D65DRAFT_292163 [Phyllosticta citribraziliensis]|uniref:Uncharacterized protein n=1 Tax=Phyllosticta citribraziliensis TaxID=989973 RepID=A0ABR1LYU7_9PEZI